MKAAWLNVFEKLGGEAYLEKFALSGQKNAAIFLNQLARMLPVKSEAEVSFGERVDLSGKSEQELREAVAQAEEGELRENVVAYSKQWLSENKKGGEA